MRIRNTTRPAAGFTLVELLVAISLIILIMSILSQAFAESAALFRDSKAIGDMQQNLRTAGVRLRDDLQQRHFEGAKKLTNRFRDFSRPQEGFLRIQPANFGAGPIFHTQEGTDGDGLPSYRGNDVLHLTVLMVGDRRENYLSTNAPPTKLNPTIPNQCAPLWQEGPNDYRGPQVFNPTPPPPNPADSEYFMNSQRAEVMWLLAPMVDPVDGSLMFAGPSGLPLYSLFRKQRLIVTDNHEALNNGANRIPAAMAGQLSGIACLPVAGSLYFPNLREMTSATYRLPYAPGGTAEERLISDVISFEIRALRPGANVFQSISEIQAAYGIAQDGTYDTATWPVNEATNQTITLRAVQITIRVWDFKTEQTRQVTIIQDI